jgi:hypothetical protein
VPPLRADIQTAVAIRLYGKNAAWKQVAQRLLVTHRQS